MTITDANGCVVESSVTVDDATPVELEPVMILSVECEGQTTGSAEVLATGGAGGYTYSWSNGVTGPIAENLEPGIYSVEAMDANGCSVGLNVEITVGEDLTPPVIVAQSVVVALNEDGLAMIDLEMIDQGTYDNCELESLSLNLSTFGCEQIGVNQVEITAIDISGNETTETVEVTVEAPPILLAVQNVTVALGANGTAVIAPESVNNGSSIACGLLSFSLSQTAFDCSDLGQNELTFIASDEYGNEAMATAMVEVLDLIAPTVLCPMDIVVNNCDGLVEYQLPEAMDNCEVASVSLVEGLGSGATFPEGTTIEVYEIVDASGNSVNCSFQVTVENDLVAEAEGTNSCASSSTGTAIVSSVIGGTGPYTYLWDNGETTVSILGLSPGTYAVTVTDATGCATETFAQVNELPALALDQVQVTNTQSGQSTGSIDLTVSGGSGSYNYLWEDENGNFVSSFEDPDGLAAGTYNVVVTDDEGCVLVVEDIVVEATTDVIEQLPGAEWEVYPNPASDLLFIDLEGLPQALSIRATLFDLTGRALLQEVRGAAKEHHLQVSLETLSSGVYWLQVAVGEQMLMEKIVVD